MTTVKNFWHGLTGAPTLNGTAGSMIAVLDACLVNGFGTVTANSVTISSGIGTVTVSTGYPFEVDSIVLISGVTVPTALNSERRVLTTPFANTFTFDATGISDQTATGTITIRFAPLGWQKVFSGTNLAVYRSQDVTGTREFLRVDDTSTTNTRVVGYESMTDINTGTGPFPTAAQISGGGFWPKSNTANPTLARGWSLIGNSKTFYIHVSTNDAGAAIGNGGCIWAFGDFVSYKAGDAYAAFLNCATNDQSNQTGTLTIGLEYGTIDSGGNGLRIPRSFTTLGSAINGCNVVESYQDGNGISGARGNVATYPNGPDNSLILSRKLIFEPNKTHLRGYFPGIIHVSQNAGSNFALRDKIVGQGVYANRKLLVIKANGAPAGNGTTAMTLFDITGPWG